MNSKDKNKKIKVLQVGRDITGTGGGKVILEVSKFLEEMDCEVVILTDAPLNTHFKVLFTPFGGKLKKWNPRTNVGKKVRHLLQLWAFMIFGTIIASKKEFRGYVIFNHNVEILFGDIVILHNVFIAEWIKDSRTFVKKLYRWFNPIFSIRILREYLVMLVKKTKYIVAVSPATLLEARNYLTKNKELISINNGVNINDYKPVSVLDKINLRSTMDLKEKDFIVLFVGHEFERKGLKYAIEAMPLLPNHVKLLILGGRGSNTSYYKKLSESLNVGDRCIFLGTKYDTEIYYNLADVFILPSAYETWALVGLEAMSSGIPVLITNTGGVKEYLKDSINGYFIEQDKNNISNKIDSLLNDKEKYKNMSIKARETAVEFSWENAAKEYLELAIKLNMKREYDV